MKCQMMHYNALLSVGLFTVLVYSKHCALRTTKYGTVCVCNSTYCDTIPEMNITAGGYQIYSSSKSNLGFSSIRGIFSNKIIKAGGRIRVNYNVTYQKIIGFGGSFTDSSGINIKSLSNSTQKKLLESYFGNTGIEYNLCRVPIGGTDFSTRGYSYDDYENDITLQKFELQSEDLNFKIPIIQMAKELRKGKTLKLFTSAWSAPKWMKTNNDWSGLGFLKEEYYQLWADYILKFFKEYQKHTINYWGVTTQNEPVDGFFPRFVSKINAMAWFPSQMNKWMGENLGPTIRNSSFKELKIMLHDDIRLTLPVVRKLLSNNLTLSYADGIAVHWYWDFLSLVTTINLKNSQNKELFVLSTEASNGYIQKVFGFGEPVQKGSWKRGENYIQDIFENLEHNVNGWVDWNLVLDENGGPTYIKNNIDSAILVNATLNEFYKQPMYYAIGHFSKFIIPESVRVQVILNLPWTAPDIKALAFLRPDNLTSVIIFNRGSSNFSLQMERNDLQTANIEIEANSINTILFY